MRPSVSILASVLLLCLLSMFLYIRDSDYYRGEKAHYVGNTVLTTEQYVELSLEYSSNHLYNTKQLNSDMIELSYDLYSTENYAYLNKAGYSILDSPTLSTLFPGILFLAIPYGVIAFLFFKKDWQSKLAVKSSNISWYLQNPTQLFTSIPLPPDGNSIVCDAVNPTIKDGIYCIRTWKIRRDCLFSAGIGQKCWHSKYAVADKIPNEHNEHGIYGHRIGIFPNDYQFYQEVIGIVRLAGEWLEHKDNVLRGSSCEIMWLILDESKVKDAESISARYNVPVTVTNSTRTTYLDWIGSANGVTCLEHNNAILKEGTWVQGKK